MEHLDSETYAALRRAEPSAVAHFRDHLARGCEPCAGFLARQDAVDLLDGGADAALAHGFSPDLDAPLDELRFARLSRALKPAPGARWAAAGGALLAVAAALLVVVNVARVRPVDEGVKGAGPAVLVELSAAAIGPSGAVAVSPGARVPADRTLVLRYRASDSGEALLLESRGDDLATLRPLGRFAISPGVHDLADRGGTEGISLSGEHGPYTLWLVVRRGAPVEAGEAQAAIRGEGGPGLTVQRFSIRVESGDTRTP